MSQTAGARSLWIGDDGGVPARARLRAVVAAFARARRLQVLVDHGFGGLLAGFGLATAVMLVSRLVPSPYPPWQLAGAVVIIALVVALLIGWRRRPDALEVAIRADLTLNLKQRLSTAWEFMVVHGDSELADRLAAQAVKAGLSARPGVVFPLHVNRWGRMAPVAAAALLLVSVIDLNRVQTPLPQEVDEQVVGEGRRLGTFGREMQARAKRDELPRSERQAEQLERLGARMESGALSRGDALEQLRQLSATLDGERKQALADTRQADARAPRAERRKDPSDAGPNAGAMLERMQRGALDSTDTRALVGRLDDLDRLGVPRQELESAVESHRAGADDALKEILEKLARIDLARMEHKELQGAREQVRRSRENLGGSLAEAEAGRTPEEGIEWDEEDERGAKNAAKASADGRLDGKPARDATPSGSQRDSDIVAGRQLSPLRPDAGQPGPILKPESQVREGELYASQGRVLPAPGRPSVKNVEMSRQFAAQVEEALSREQYPDHYKEFIRRYFLTLSQGAGGQQQQLPRGTP